MLAIRKNSEFLVPLGIQYRFLFHKKHLRVAIPQQGLLYVPGSQWSEKRNKGKRNKTRSEKRNLRGLGEKVEERQ